MINISKHYSLAISIMASMIFAALLVFERFKVTPSDLPNIEIFLLICSLISAFFMAYFWWGTSNDLSNALFVVFAMFATAVLRLNYVYGDFAFIMISFVAVFFGFKRPWLFPVVVLIGSTFLVFSFFLDAYVKPVHRVLGPWDKVGALATLCAFVLIFYYAVFEKFRRYSLNMRRVSILGMEANRLLHDIKGMMASPLLVMENIKEAKVDSEAKTHEKVSFLNHQLNILQNDMDHIRNVIRNINSLSIENRKTAKVDITESIKKCILILDSRLRGVDVHLKFDHLVLIGRRDLFDSIFFNLMVNSLEAFHQQRIENPKITIYRSGDFLIYQDNAGGLKSTQIDLFQEESASGIGLKMIAYDLAAMKFKYQIKDHEGGLKFEIKLPKNA